MQTAICPPDGTYHNIQTELPIHFLEAEWTPVTNALPIFNNLMSPFQLVDQNLSYHVNQRIATKSFNSYSSKLSYIKHLPNAFQHITRFMTQHHATAISDVASHLGILGQAVTIPISISNLFRGCEPLNINKGHLLPITTAHNSITLLGGITELAKRMHGATATLFKTLGSTFSLISAPFIGIETYRNYHKFLEREGLIENLKELLKAPFEHKSIKEVGHLFLKKGTDSEFSSWAFHERNFFFLSNDVSADSLIKFIELIKTSHYSKEFKKEKLTQARELITEIIYSLEKANYMTGITSTLGTLAASYSIGSILTPAQFLTAGIVATLGAKVFVGSAVILGSSYIVYEGAKFIMDTGVNYVF